MGPERLRSCPHLQRSETGGCLCRHESPSSDSMDRGQGSGWQGGGLWGRLCTDGSMAYSRDSEGGLPGRDMNNKPELRCGGGLNKTSLQNSFCALYMRVPLYDRPPLLLQGPCSPDLVTHPLKFTSFFFFFLPPKGGGDHSGFIGTKSYFKTSPNCYS